MHISEGVLSPAILGAGYALTALGTLVGLRKADYGRLVTTAVLAAVFFGLGVNVFDMAFPAVLCHYLFRSWLCRGRTMRLAGSFLCGALSVAGAALFTALALALTDEGFWASAKILLLAHLPVMVLEGIMVALIVSYIAKTRPNLLQPAATLGGKI